MEDTFTSTSAPDNLTVPEKKALIWIAVGIVLLVLLKKAGKCKKRNKTQTG